MKANTVILFKFRCNFYDDERIDVEPGCTLYYPAEPEEIARWSLRDIKKARLSLAEFCCTYTENHELNCVEAEEYILQRCRCDSLGNIVEKNYYECEPAPEKIAGFGEYCLMQEYCYDISGSEDEKYIISELHYVSSFDELNDIEEYIKVNSDGFSNKSEFSIYRTKDTDIIWDIRSMCLGRIEKQDADPVMIVK